MSLRNPPLVLALLALLTLVTFFSRAWRLDAGLPYRTEPDAVLVWQANSMGRLARAEVDEDTSHLRVYTFYPLLLARLVFALPGNSAPLAAPYDAPLERHLAAAAEPYVRARWVSMVLSTLLVPLTYLLARRFLDPAWALLAAAFAATSVLHASLAQMARPHGPLATTCLLSVFLSLRLLERGGLRATLLAGLSAGIAVGTLHSGAFVLPTAVAAAWFAPAARGPGRLARVGILLAIVAALVVWSYPFLFDQLQLVSREADDKALIVGDQTVPLNLYGPGGYKLIVPNLFAVDPVLVIGTLAGLLALFFFLRGRPELRRPLWIGALHPFFTFLLFGLHPVVASRFLLPTVPWLALLTAIGLYTMLRGSGRSTLALAVALLALAFPTAALAYSLHFRGTEDSQTRLARWLEREVPPGRFPIVATHGISLPLFLKPQRWSPETNWAWSPWIEYQVEFHGAAPRRAALDVLPLFADKAPATFEQLVRDLAYLAPGLFIVRRPIIGHQVELFGRPLARERLVDAFGQPLLVLDPGRPLESSLARRLLTLLPKDLARIATRSYPGMGYEVYALPRTP